MAQAFHRRGPWPSSGTTPPPPRSKLEPFFLFVLFLIKLLTQKESPHFLVEETMLQERGFSVLL